MSTTRSEALLARGQHLIPGGVNSPVRAFRSVGGTPRFIARAQGARMFDVDDNEFIDYIGSWGPMLIGHRHPAILAAIEKALTIGTSFGAPTELELELAEEIIDAVPSIEMLRLVNSGTEATMSALRVARGFTGRDLTIKFEGCYHGHVDSLLVKAGSGMATLGIADTQGVPKGFTDTTLALPYNSVEALEQAFRERGDLIAAVILEPVVGNMGCVIPTPEFLAALVHLTQKHGALLIFDEVMTGFRLARGGAQELFGIRPDLSRDVMSKVAPVGPIYQAGTLSGNPLAVSAGLGMLRHIKSHPEIYPYLDRITARLVEAPPAGVTVNRVGSMFTMFFTETPVVDYETAKTSDTARFGKFFHHLLSEGVYIAPSQFEAGFVSAAHTEEDIEATRAAIGRFFA
ncbi:MAG: glutamate-1-semialdehyde 2,1-aminomutase [Acidobacteria bacterium]|nr:glutamate-1-semialdehyde 2,1-aminomutase [Acidobacteriota bacterium]